MTGNGKTAFGVAAVALLALGLMLPVSPAFAAKIKPGNLPSDGDCVQDQVARWNGSSWECADYVDPATVANLQKLVRNLFVSAGGQIVFLTSTTHSGDLDGNAGADGICNSLATTAGLPGNYKAWLGGDDDFTGGNVPPSSRFTHSPIGYMRPDGVIIAYNWSELTNREAGDPLINVDELGTTHSDSLETAWTNVNDNGSLTYQGGAQTCEYYSADVATWVGQFGSPNDVSNWTVGGSQFCNSLARLYCFGGLSGP